MKNTNTVWNVRYVFVTDIYIRTIPTDTAKYFFLLIVLLHHIIVAANISIVFLMHICYCFRYVLMNSLQILENKAAKLIVLDVPQLSSATEALKLLNWTPLKIRRHKHCCILIFKKLTS